MLERGLGVVHGARPDYHEEPRVFAIENRFDRSARFVDSC